MLYIISRGITGPFLDFGYIPGDDTTKYKTSHLFDGKALPGYRSKQDGKTFSF